MGDEVAGVAGTPGVSGDEARCGVAATHPCVRRRRCRRRRPTGIDDVGGCGTQDAPSAASIPVPEAAELLRKLQYVQSEPSAENSDSPKTATATCPSGTVVVGTGFQMAWNTGEELVSSVVPTETTVSVTAHEDETGAVDDWSTYEGHWAYCSDGKLPVSAGFTVNLNRNVLVSHFYGYPGQDYSYVIAREDEDGSPTTWTLTVDVVCVTPAPEIPSRPTRVSRTQGGPP
jgi:hypothetical protein